MQSPTDPLPRSRTWLCVGAGRGWFAKAQGRWPCQGLLLQTTSWHQVGSCARPWGEASAQRASQCHPTGPLPMRSCRWGVTSRAPGCTLVMSPHLLKHSEPGISLVGWQHHETGQEKFNGWGWSHRTGWLSPNVGNSSNYQTKLSREYRLLSHGTVSQTEVTVRLTSFSGVRCSTQEPPVFSLNSGYNPSECAALVSSSQDWNPNGWMSSGTHYTESNVWDSQRFLFCFVLKSDT